MAKDTVLLITADSVGRGDDELGRILMRSFLKTLKESPELPGTALFLNSGVFLTTEGSPLLDDLAALTQAGVEIYSCGTCLDFYNLRDKLRAGSVGNMAMTVARLMSADHVVSP